MRRRFTTLLISVLCMASPAFAAAPDTGQALALQKQITDSFATIFGQKTVPVLVAPSGDHYQVSVPLAQIYQQFGIPITGLGDLTGSLAPLDHGRWALDNFALPVPTHFTIDPGLPNAPGPVSVDLFFHNLVSHNVIDLAFASPWTGTSTGDGYDMNISGNGLDQVAHVGAFNAQGALTPESDGRLDLTQKLEVHSYTSESKLPDGGSLHTGIARIAAKLHFDQLDRARFAESFGLVQAAGAKHADGEKIPDAEFNALLHSVIVALRGAVSGGGIAESLDGIVFQDANLSFNLNHFETDFAADAPAGLLGARMHLVMDGPSSPMIPPTALPYVPSHLSFATFISGIGVAELTQLALDATAPEPQPATDPSVLFAHGSLAAGVDNLEVLIGQTTIKGSGKLMAPAADQITGHATVTASHFEALFQNVQKDKVLGPQALPVLILVRGLAKPDGDRLVWEIAYEGGSVTVNGTDLTGMTGGSN